MVRVRLVVFFFITHNLNIQKNNANGEKYLGALIFDPVLTGIFKAAEPGTFLGFLAADRHIRRL